MKSFTTKQFALFQVQLWHQRKLRQCEKTIREMEHVQRQHGPISKECLQLLKSTKRAARLRIKKHRAFSDAITPFVLP